MQQPASVIVIASVILQLPPEHVVLPRTSRLWVVHNGSSLFLILLDQSPHTPARVLNVLISTGASPEGWKV